MKTCNEIAPYDDGHSMPIFNFKLKINIIFIRKTQPTSVTNTNEWTHNIALGFFRDNAITPNTQEGYL